MSDLENENSAQTITNEVRISFQHKYSFGFKILKGLSLEERGHDKEDRGMHR